jgi:hypothetical protein
MIGRHLKMVRANSPTIVNRGMPPGVFLGSDPAFADLAFASFVLGDIFLGDPTKLGMPHKAIFQLANRIAASPLIAKLFVAQHPPCIGMVGVEHQGPRRGTQRGADVTLLAELAGFGKAFLGLAAKIGADLTFGISRIDIRHNEHKFAGIRARSPD